GGKVDVLFRLGQRLLLVLLDELGGGIDVALGAVHAAKVRPRRGSGHPARTGRLCARRRVRATVRRGEQPDRRSACSRGRLSDGSLGLPGGESDPRKYFNCSLPYLAVVKSLSTVDTAIQ